MMMIMILYERETESERERERQRQRQREQNNCLAKIVLIFCEPYKNSTCLQKYIYTSTLVYVCIWADLVY